MHACVEAYLDIETTGLSPRYSEITVVGIHICSGTETRFVQLVGDGITADCILEALDGVGLIYTYNGSRFDLPFIHYCLGINLVELFPHRDLMYDCWENNLYGGLKKVEKQLGIGRELPDISGYDAVRLWWRYAHDDDAAALETLTRYNREDVVNLKELKDILLLHLEDVYSV